MRLQDALRWLQPSLGFDADAVDVADVA
jgi:hypothetical protein